MPAKGACFPGVYSGGTNRTCPPPAGTEPAKADALSVTFLRPQSVREPEPLPAPGARQIPLEEEAGAAPPARPP